PVNEHGTPYYIFFGNESPKAAVITYVAIVAHSEVTLRGNDHVVALNVLLQHQLPIWKKIVVFGRRDRGEVIAIRVIAVRTAVNDVRLVKLFSVAIDHAIAQMDAIPRHSDDALHHVQPRLSRRQENHDVASPDVAIGQQGAHPLCGRRKLFTIYKHVVADQQRVLHRTGWNLKGLNDKGDDKETGHEDSGERR